MREEGIFQGVRSRALRVRCGENHPGGTSGADEQIGFAQHAHSAQEGDGDNVIVIDLVLGQPAVEHCQAMFAIVEVYKTLLCIDGQRFFLPALGFPSTAGDMVGALDGAELRLCERVGALYPSIKEDAQAMVADDILDGRGDVHPR